VHKVNPSTGAAPTCVDLFAGCGGLAEGLLAEGIDVVAAVELHPQAALTHAFNHPGTDVFAGDIRGWDPARLGPALGRRGRDSVDLVVGGPPCQGFSSAGKKILEDPRNDLFRSFVQVVGDLRPRMFLLENVPGFARRYGGAVHTEALEAFGALGYELSGMELHAAEFGVPQRRRRFVLVGWLPGAAKPFAWPEPAGRVTAGQALDDLAFLEPGFEAARYDQGPTSAFAAERRGGSELLFNHLATLHRDRAVAIMSQIPEGGTIGGVDEAVRSGKRTMARLRRDGVANTVLSLPDDMIHYRHDRILTVRESARLQTFDDDFVFFGKRTSGFVERRVDVPQYTQVGNAVPPLLARALGRSLLRSLDADGQDLRDLARRRRRHALVVGSSGFAGYELADAAADELALTTVAGEPLELPVSGDALPVAEQPALARWSRPRGPVRRQWAPGVLPRAHPAWSAG
jgi:DNA (cytosine-5)-methyltransferase 1